MTVLPWWVAGLVVVFVLALAVAYWLLVEVGIGEDDDV